MVRSLGENGAEQTKSVFHNPLFVTLNLFQGLITQMLKRVQHDTAKTRNNYVGYEIRSKSYL